MDNRTPTVTGASYLPDVVSRYPATRAVFDRYGLQGCGDRESRSRRREGVDLAGLLVELKQSTEHDLVDPARLVSITRMHQAEI